MSNYNLRPRGRCQTRRVKIVLRIKKR